MGMDVYGKEPANKTGEYFRRSVWGWHPLADYVTESFPDLTAGCSYWQSNDGDGLDADDSRALSDALLAAVADGTVAAYVSARDAALDALPSEECRYCRGTGLRTDKVGTDMGMHVPGGRGCNGCNGKGSRRPFDCSYGLEVSDISEFADFLAACGGFEIC